MRGLPSSLTVLPVVAALLLGGCNQQAHGADASGPTCTPQTASDGAVYYDCLGGRWLQCTGNAAPYGPCGLSPSPCMGCSDGVGFGCTCEDGGVPGMSDASSWVCVGTEYTCQ